MNLDTEFSSALSMNGDLVFFWFQERIVNFNEIHWPRGRKVKKDLYRYTFSYKH
jgi:hypothetical protein